MSVSTHPRFSGYLPPLPAPFREPRLLSIKIEPAPAPMPDATMFDLTIEDAGRLYVLPFVEIRDGELMIPDSYAAYTPVVSGLESQLRAFDERFRADRQPSLEVFAANSDVAEWAALQDPYELVIPGLAPYGVLFDVIDRYRYASTVAEGRAVVDLHPMAGYGAVVLGRRPASYQAVCDSEVSTRALARFAFAAPSEAAPMSADLVLALGIPPERVAAVAQRAAEYRASHVILTSPGDAGRDALADAGYEPQAFLRPGLERAPIADYVAHVAPKRVFAAVSIESKISVAARPLSILLVLRPSAEKAFGGDVVQVRETAAALRARGHQVILSTEARPVVPDGTDVVHLTNLTCPDETLTQAESVKRFPGPIVMMPIFIDHADETVWGMQASFDAIRFAGSSNQLADNQSAVRERRMSIVRADGAELQPPPVRTDLYENYTAKQLRILEHVDYLIANAYSEVYCIQRHMTTEIPFAIAPSCCDPSIYDPARAAEFVERYNVRDFILSTGRLEARKQQLTLMQIARRWPDRRLVLIGRNADIAYGAMLRLCWTPNVTIMGHMPEEELAGAYAAARVVAMPSWDEVVSLSAVNAAASGASLVLTRNGFEHEYMRDDAEYVDPGSIESIADAVDRAWRSHEARYERRMALSARVRSDYTWAKSAEATEEAYYRVLADNPRGARRVAR